MTLTMFNNRMLPWLSMSGLGLGLFFVGAIGGYGLPIEGLGMALLSVGTWISVDALHRAPPSEGEAAVAPGEWQAWVGVAFVGAILAVMLASADVFGSPVPIPENPEAGVVGRSVGGLFLAWLTLSHVLRGRWSGKVQTDERDGEIALRASQWGRGATALVVFGVAAVLGFGEPERLATWSFPLFAHLLTTALVWGMWVDHLMAALQYWRDRRAAA